MCYSGTYCIHMYLQVLLVVIKVVIIFQSQLLVMFLPNKNKEYPLFAGLLQILFYLMSIARKYFLTPMTVHVLHLFLQVPFLLFCFTIRIHFRLYLALVCVSASVCATACLITCVCLHISMFIFHVHFVRWCMGCITISYVSDAFMQLFFHFLTFFYFLYFIISTCLCTIIVCMEEMCIILSVSLFYPSFFSCLLYNVTVGGVIFPLIVFIEILSAYFMSVASVI